MLAVVEKSLCPSHLQNKLCKSPILQWKPSADPFSHQADHATGGVNIPPPCQQRIGRFMARLWKVLHNRLHETFTEMDITRLQ